MCRACGEELTEGRGQRPKKRKDPFLRKVIAGARLREAMDVRPHRIVYRAEHAGLKTDVRVEVFPAAFADAHGPYMRALFDRVTKTYDLRSSRTVSLLDLGRRRDCWFIVTDFAPSTLRDTLNARGRLDVNTALSRAEEMLEGLVAVHEMGERHGGVNPDDVLLGYEGSVRLGHLGMLPRPGAADERFVTRGGTVTGPGVYLASECGADGSGGDIRSDLYSLGVTLHEMLAGAPPPAQLPQGVPAAVAGFVGELMSEVPEDGPQTPGEALERLRELAVDLSRRKEIQPVSAAFTPRQRGRSAMKWALAWTVVAVTMVMAGIVPIIMMARQREEREAGRLELGQRKVYVVVRQEPGALEEELPEGQVAAVQALIAYRLAFRPELEVVDLLYVDELRRSGLAAEAAHEAIGAQNMVAASYAPGVARRHWALTYVGRHGKEPWSVQTECTIDDAEPDGLAPLARAVDGLLAQAAAPLGIAAAEGETPLAGASTEAWSLLARSRAAERDEAWDEALEYARAARALAPDAGPMVVAVEFYVAIAALDGPGPYPAPTGTPTALSPQGTALREVLTAMASGDASLAGKAFPDYLVAFPRSARGYYLLGAWRMRPPGRHGEALAAFRQAVRLDPGYMPASLAAVRLMAEIRPDDLPGFLEEQQEAMVDKEDAERLARAAESMAEPEATPAPR